MKLVNNRRAIHKQRLESELRALEKMQKEYTPDNSKRKDKDLDLITSDDSDDA